MGSTSSARLVFLAVGSQFALAPSWRFANRAQSAVDRKPGRGISSGAYTGPSGSRAVHCGSSCALFRMS